MSDSNADNGSLDRIIAEYLESLERGDAPDPQVLLARFPEHADELRSFLENDARLTDLAAPVTMPLSDTGLEVGDRIRYFGDYELTDEIARGGMGIVYRARQVSLGRTVAVKMILAGQLAGDEDVKRFHAEAEAAAQLDHPAIVSIYEVGEHSGRHYFSMQYVGGTDLARKTREAPLAPEEAVGLLVQVVDAIAYAHDQGVLHRDLKPSNVLIDASGQPLVTDFGLAKRIDAASDLTSTGQIVGTPSYMPPEQAAGRKSAIGTASDVYSLGAVLYEALTGRAPFRADTALGTLRQVLDPDVETASPRLLNPAIDRDLETIVLKCLEKEPGGRYGTARELGDDLRRWQRGEPILARPVGGAEKAWRWCRRNPAVAGLSALVLALLLIVASVSAAGYVKTRRALEAEQLALEQATRRRQEAEAERQVARANLYAAHLNLAQAAWDDGDVEKAYRHLDHYRADETRREWTWGYLWGLATAGWDELPGRVGIVEGLGFSQDGSRLAVAHGDRIEIRNGRTGEIEETHRLDGRMEAFDLAPDGGRGLTGDRGGMVTVWDLDDGSVVYQHEDQKRVTAVAWARDGALFASGGRSGSVVVRRSADGELVHRFEEMRYGIADLVFSPDGRALAAVERISGKLVLWALSDGSVVWSRPGVVGDTAGGVAFAPDGESLAVTSTRLVTSGRVQTLNAADGSLTQEVALERETSSVAFAGEGYLLVGLGGASGSVARIDLERGVVDHWFWGAFGMLEAIALDPRERRFVTGGYDGVLRSWPLDGTDRTFQRWDDVGQVQDLVHLPSGDLITVANGLAVREMFSVVTRWEGSTTSARWTARLKGGLGRHLAASPTGDRLVAVQLSGRQSGQLSEIDPESGEVTQGPELPWRPDGAAFTADGSGFVVVGEGKGVVGFDLPGWGRRFEIELPEGASGLVSLPGGRLAAAGSQVLLVLDDRTGETVQTVPVPVVARAMALSPDAAHLALGGERVVLVDTESWTVSSRLEGAGDGIMALAFHPEGRTLSGSGFDNRVHLWDARFGVELGTLPSMEGPVNGLSFTPDGAGLVTSSTRSSPEPTGDLRLWSSIGGGEAELPPGLVLDEPSVGPLDPGKSTAARASGGSAGSTAERRSPPSTTP